MDGAMLIDVFLPQMGDGKKDGQDTVQEGGEDGDYYQFSSRIQDAHKDRG